ncbi:MAG TPA: NAD(P)H-hydrate dehydratase [Pirellulales bacterium]|jgi:NAD(P)H-hydrate epimerase|nr:NAD(P)H-hydrate dehydratase [Pirellulales bacterium]
MHLPRLAPRRPESHKGDFGHALLIGGSQGMAGSISLSAMACLRSGAGLVTVATPAACQTTVAGFEPSLMTAALPCDEEGRIASAGLAKIRELAGRATVVACGPGLGRSLEVTGIVAALYSELRQPMVVDADGLNALSTLTNALPNHAGPRVLTPHPGEFARLMRASNMPPEERPSAAVDLASRAGIIVLLKGHPTLVTDGPREWRNPTGNPGMATGGTGDILTGVIAALLCQGMSPLEAAQLGAYVHGLAGDLAAEKLGQVSMIASDLLRFLPDAFMKLAATPD